MKGGKLSISKTYLCGKCEKEIIENAKSKDEESIECTACNRWFHSGCTPLTPHVFEIMCTSDNIKFFCTECEDSKGKEKTLRGFHPLSWKVGSFLFLSYVLVGTQLTELLKDELPSHSVEISF